MKSETLSYSEQRAMDGILLLARLGLVPSEAWDAVDWGRVEDVDYSEGFGGIWKLKKRTVIVEWNEIGVAARLVLRAEIPLEGYSVTAKEMQAKGAQKRWWVREIQIADLSTAPAGKSAEEVLDIADKLSMGLKIEGDNCLLFLSGEYLKE